MRMVERDHRIWACRPSTRTGDGGETAGWLHEAQGQLFKTWLRRWDEHAQPALWIHRTTPDLRLQRKPTPFSPFFGRDARTQLDATHPEIDGGGYRGRIHSYVADKRQAYYEVRDVRVAILKRHKDKHKSRESRNAETSRTSVRTRVVVAFYPAGPSAYATLPFAMIKRENQSIDRKIMRPAKNTKNNALPAKVSYHRFVSQIMLLCSLQGHISRQFIRCLITKQKPTPCCIILE